MPLGDTAIRNVFLHFVSICRQPKLLSQGVVAVDGSKFKAVNNRDRNFTPHKLAKRMQQVEHSSARDRDALDTADRTQPVDLQARTTRLQDKLVKLRKQMQHLREIEVELAKQPDQQFSQTDPDAGSMATHMAERRRVQTDVIDVGALDRPRQPIGSKPSIAPTPRPAPVGPASVC